MAKKINGFEWARMTAFSNYSKGLLVSNTIKRTVLEDSQLKYASQIMSFYTNGITKHPTFIGVDKLYNPNWN